MQDICRTIAGSRKQGRASEMRSRKINYTRIKGREAERCRGDECMRRNGDLVDFVGSVCCRCKVIDFFFQYSSSYYYYYSSFSPPPYYYYHYYLAWSHE